MVNSCKDSQQLTTCGGMALLLTFQLLEVKSVLRSSNSITDPKLTVWNVKDTWILEMTQYLVCTGVVRLDGHTLLQYLGCQEVVTV
jgi:hypothetical protein